MNAELLLFCVFSDGTGTRGPKQSGLKEQNPLRERQKNRALPKKHPPLHCSEPLLSQSNLDRVSDGAQASLQVDHKATLRGSQARRG